MMNIGWVITGIILLGGIVVAAVRLYMTRRAHDSSLNSSNEFKI